MIFSSQVFGVFEIIFHPSNLEGPAWSEQGRSSTKYLPLLNYGLTVLLGIDKALKSFCTHSPDISSELFWKCLATHSKLFARSFTTKHWDALGIAAFIVN